MFVFRVFLYVGHFVVVIGFMTPANHFGAFKLCFFKYYKQEKLD